MIMFLQNLNLCKSNALSTAGKQNGIIDSVALVLIVKSKILFLWFSGFLFGDKAVNAKP